MDPLSAVGLAGTIIQFVTFTQDLLSTASDIHDSATGGLLDVQNLQSICQSLHQFSLDLASRGRFQPNPKEVPDDESFKESVEALGDICRTCKRDCDRISEIAARIQVKDESHRRLKSFRAALELAWKRKEVAELDNRMQRTQAALTLHICAISRYSALKASAAADSLITQSAVLTMER